MTGLVTPSGARHVFHHIGAGTFAGADTFLSRFFVCNPILFREEVQSFSGALTRVYVDPRCLVTTPFDMIMNQVIEESRGTQRHGSCGVGFGETIERSQLEPFNLTVLDLARGREWLLTRLSQIVAIYIPWRLAMLRLDSRSRERFSDARILDRFVEDCESFSANTWMQTRPAESPIVFEGAQGLLLDQDNRESFPHVTRSHTGIRNVLTLCDEWEISNVEAVYVTRTYLTRHGAGPLTGERASIPGASDDTNVPHPFQGTLRYAPLDAEDVCDRAVGDALANRFVGQIRAHLAVTHCDQVAPSATLMRAATYWSEGPTRTDVMFSPPPVALVDRDDDGDDMLPARIESRYPNDVVNEAAPDDGDGECALCLAHPTGTCNEHFVESLPF